MMRNDMRSTTSGEQDCNLFHGLIKQHSSNCNHVPPALTSGNGENRGVSFNASTTSDIKLSSTAAVYTSEEDYLEQGIALEMVGRQEQIAVLYLSPVAKPPSNS